MSETVQRSGHAVVGRLAPEAMELLWRQGKSMAAISRQGGVSRERVRQILAQRGITGRQPRPKMVMYPQKVEAEGDVHERVVVSTGHLAGRGYICVRKWFRSSREDGQWYPTRLGVNLRADLFTLETLVELAEAMGVGIITGPGRSHHGRTRR